MPIRRDMAQAALTHPESISSTGPENQPSSSSPFRLSPATSLADSHKSSSTMETNVPLVMAYFPDWVGDAFPPETINFSQFDWIDFAFGIPTADFDISWDSDKTPELLRRLKTAAHRNGKKVKLSIGGWTGSTYFSTAVATQESRYLFACNILGVYNDFGLDGIDIDWEYPGHPGAPGNKVDPQDSANFLLFLHCLRSVLPLAARITAAAQTVPFVDPSGAPMGDVSQFAGILDWLLLMNYDVWSSSSKPGPNAPLLDACQNSTQPEANAVSAFAKWTSAGFPVDKLVLGLPTYGYISSSRASGLRQRGKSFGTVVHSTRSRRRGPVKVTNEWGGADGEIPFQEILKQGALVRQPGSEGTQVFFNGSGGFDRLWDGCSATPFLRSESSGQIITYDDTESLGMKAKFAKEVGMLGVNLFDTHGDTVDWDLVIAVRKALGCA
ncbi:hypothetical protein H0H81_006778 [Sphagnurus paluster]|uniref:GH18 domain-containing protein n=1 Tax=Sphagnurus paluster TaxID=117069 RepID=A0A9P7GNW5_9AGAR|nr:hypothetical protein H0H81_006778 [Sphagnurus paluster]